MGLPTIVAFTDTYLPTINGVTYTVKSWREDWQRRGGTMDVVFPRTSEYEPEEGEYPVRSLPFPFYEGFRVGVPQVPNEVHDAEIVHAHTPFGVGLSGLRLSKSTGAPLVASYHTPTSEYAEYVSFNGTVERTVRHAARSYERWFLEQTEVVIAPSERTREHIRTEVGASVPVEVVPNGVDIEHFSPRETDAFRARHGLAPDRTLLGYTGRHGYEKCLSDIFAATDGMDVTVVFGGDGPARDELEARAETADVDVRFLGFLDREELPAFYATLDVFLFPSPVETQGLVALEANACGTPVVGVDSGALSNTIVEGENGYTYPRGQISVFRAAIERALDERESLRESCLATREEISIEHAVDDLQAVYDRVLTANSATTSG